ncbi:MAG: FAD-dependent oxidoreductase, partial [Muribaculaceae bacterium]|nr:FAD-dependent oxidoreductase [Muribaculaceae bacterium]
RIHCNEEVNQGRSEEQAVLEATRCLDCPDPQCVSGCPVSIDIPGFIKNIQRGRADLASSVLRATSALPAVCGRVCPQEKQCESRCLYNRMKKPPVAIGWLERYAADAARRTGAPCPMPAERLGIKVAVVGSGPAGLSFAGDMIMRGYDVTVYEALHEIGGVLKYGIPEFRLPNEVVEAELDMLRRQGVEFVSDVIIGKTLSYDDLLDMGYRGIFVASGAGLPRFMGIEGENLIGIMSSNEYLTRVNLMGAGRPGYDTPVAEGRRVAVVGGGNTAMDSVRTALRLGASRAMIIYRRGETEMPARIEEVAHAKEEGVEFITLANPVEYLGDERGHVRAMRIQRMELGEPDASGRRSPRPIPGAIDEIEVDEVIVAVGVS